MARAAGRTGPRLFDALANNIAQPPRPLTAQCRHLHKSYFVVRYIRRLRPVFPRLERLSGSSNGAGDQPSSARAASIFARIGVGPNCEAIRLASVRCWMASERLFLAL